MTLSKKTKKKDKDKDAFQGYVVLSLSKRRRKRDDEIVITSKGRVSFPSSVIYKNRDQKIFCTVLYSEGKQELIFIFGDTGVLEVLKGSIEMYSVLNKHGILPKEKIFRKFYVIDMKDGSIAVAIRLR